ncbi:hypothetical protein BGZ49_000672, partial [Haplosporangium sp. Z 27]
MHDRMLFLLSNMIGMNVEVTVKNGSKYEGLFNTVFTEGELGIVLRLARTIPRKDKKEPSPLKPQLIIQPKDCVAINVVGVDFVPHERSGLERGDREGFKTDTDISRSGEIRERDLKKWAPEEYTSVGGIEDDLGDSQNNGKAGWDQFAANERLFGVKTDFDEELYTTKLDRTGADFKAREQQAIQIANEIQQSVSNNVHMREERGLSVDDSGLDEEDLYGAVVRDPVPASNKYMPPAMRRQQELNQKRPSAPSQQQSRSASAVTLQAPAPQPASQPVTQADKPLPQASLTTPAATLSQPQKPASTEKAPASAAVAPSGTTSGTTAPANKPAERATVSRSSSTKGSNPQFNLSELRTHHPISTLMNAATIQGSKNQSIPDHALDSKQIEDKFTSDLNNFTTNDKARVKETKMELSQLKFQKDIEMWKKIGENLTKKIVTPMPTEVMEIFKKGSGSAAGDKSNNVASTNDIEEEKDKNKVTKDAKPETTKPSSATTTNTTSAPTEKPIEKTTVEKATVEKATVASGNSFKFNIKASVFKPNVNAAPFTPSFATGEKKASNVTLNSDKNQFLGKTIKKGPIPLKEFMPNPFKKGPPIDPSTVGPTWEYGDTSFRHLFHSSNRYEDSMMYTQGMGQHDGSGSGGYYAMTPYNYSHAGQFGVPPSMAMAAPSHMVAFGGHVPFTQPPPPGMPHAGVGPGFPQMPPSSAAHYPPQGFPGRPPAGMHIPMYPYPPAAHGPQVIMRYPEMIPPMAPNGMMMHQRPMGVEQQMHYPPAGRKSGANE